MKYKATEELKERILERYGSYWNLCLHTEISVEMVARAFGGEEIGLWELIQLSHAAGLNELNLLGKEDPEKR